MCVSFTFGTYWEVSSMGKHKGMGFWRPNFWSWQRWPKQLLILHTLLQCGFALFHQDMEGIHPFDSGWAHDHLTSRIQWKWLYACLGVALCWPRSIHFLPLGRQLPQPGVYHEATMLWKVQVTWRGPGECDTWWEKPRSTKVPHVSGEATQAVVSQSLLPSWCHREQRRTSARTSWPIKLGAA